MSLITRILPPDNKNAKLTFTEMDSNLYYLQSLGVSDLTFSSSTLTLTNPTGGTKTVTINDYYTTGATYSNGLIYFDRNDILSAYTVNISSLTGDANTFITAVTYTSSANTITLTDNTNNSFNAYINSVSGLTVNGGLSATTLYATTYQNLPSAIFSGGTVSGQTNFVSGLTSNTISATTYQNVPSFVNMVFTHSSVNPADTTTYYIGALSSLSPSTANRDAWSVNSQYTGNITEVSIISNFGGGSSGNSTMTLHNLSAGTSQIITSTLQYVTGTPVQILFEPFSAATQPAGWSSFLVTYTTYAGLTGTTSTLTSPLFDGTAYSSLNIQTDVAKFGAGTDGPILIEYSLNSGSTWNTAGTTATPTGSTNYVNSTVSVPSTSTQMLIRFSVNPTGTSGKRLRNVYFFGLSSSINNNYVLSSPLSVTSGDKLQIRWSTPTWATNPSGVTNLFNLKLRL